MRESITRQSKDLDAHFLHNHSPSADGARLAAGRRKHVERSASSADMCWPPPWIQLSSNNNPEQQTILITEQRASGCSRGQRPSAAYYSHCSPNDPAGLLRTAKLSEQLPARNLRVDFCLPRVGFNGKGKLNFSLKFNCLTWSRSLLSAFHTTEPFLSSFILFFFRGLDPPAASSYLATPREQYGPRPYLREAHFPEGNLPASTLGSALKWWTSETWPLFVCSPLISQAERCCCCHLASPRYLHHWHHFSFPLFFFFLLSSSHSIPPSGHNLEKNNFKLPCINKILLHSALLLVEARKYLRSKYFLWRSAV